MAGMLVADGGFGFITAGAKKKMKMKFDMDVYAGKVKNSLLISINSSTAMSLPVMGSTPFSWMYFSMRRRSKMLPECGEMTGTSGTSLDTGK